MFDGGWSPNRGKIKETRTIFEYPLKEMVDLGIMSILIIRTGRKNQRVQRR